MLSFLSALQSKNDTSPSSPPRERQKVIEEALGHPYNFLSFCKRYLDVGPLPFSHDVIKDWEEHMPRGCWFKFKNYEEMAETVRQTILELGDYYSKNTPEYWPFNPQNGVKILTFFPRWNIERVHTVDYTHGNWIHCKGWTPMCFDWPGWQKGEVFELYVPKLWNGVQIKRKARVIDFLADFFLKEKCDDAVAREEMEARINTYENKP